MVPIVKHRCTIKLVVAFWCKSHSDSFRVPNRHCECYNIQVINTYKFHIDLRCHAILCRRRYQVRMCLR
jgi:hypothetical protein